MKFKCISKDCWKLADDVFTSQFKFEQKSKKLYAGEFSESIQSVVITLDLRDKDDNVFNKYEVGKEYYFDVNSPKIADPVYNFTEDHND